MENPIVPKEVTEIQHATAEQIYEVNERVMEATSSVAKANEALDTFASSLIGLEKNVKEYNSKKATVRNKMQQLNMIM